MRNFDDIFASHVKETFESFDTGYEPGQWERFSGGARGSVSRTQIMTILALAASTLFAMPVGQITPVYNEMIRVEPTEIVSTHEISKAKSIHLKKEKVLSETISETPKVSDNCKTDDIVVEPENESVIISEAFKFKQEFMDVTFQRRFSIELPRVTEPDKGHNLEMQGLVIQQPNAITLESMNYVAELKPINLYNSVNYSPANMNNTGNGYFFNNGLMNSGANFQMEVSETIPQYRYRQVKSAKTYSRLNYVNFAKANYRVDISQRLNMESYILLPIQNQAINSNNFIIGLSTNIKF